MLDHVTIKNFRCLRDVSVPLKPLTVLIGENDTGKSTFLEAVALRGRYTLEMKPLDHWREGPENRISVEFRDESASETSAVAAELDDYTPASPGTAPHVALQSLAAAMKYRLGRRDGNEFFEPSFYRLSKLNVAPDKINFSGTQIAPPQSEEEKAAAFARSLSGNPIAPDGSNVPGILDQMLRTRLARFLELQDRCRELVPGFEAFSLEVPERGELELALRLDGDLTVPSHRLSAGVRALILYLTLAYRPDAPDVVLIEEPENGLHPRRLGEVMTLLRLLTEPKADGRRTQVILTTHSPFLLDHVKPDEDQILIFQRQDDGSRTATPADWNRARGFLKHFSPGEIWFNRGEASLVPAPELDESDDRFDALGRPVTPAADGTGPSAGADAAGPVDARAAA